MPGEFHDCSWMFWSRHCSRKGTRRVEERKKKTKMTKLDFHRFQVRHFSNNFEQSPCYCKMGATPESRSKCLKTYKIQHQAKYQRLNANTLYVATILFSRSSLYTGSHYRASLIDMCSVYCVYASQKGQILVIQWSLSKADTIGTNKNCP